MGIWANLFSVFALNPNNGILWPNVASFFQALFITELRFYLGHFGPVWANFQTLGTNLGHWAIPLIGDGPWPKFSVSRVKMVAKTNVGFVVIFRPDFQPSFLAHIFTNSKNSSAISENTPGVSGPGTGVV